MGLLFNSSYPDKFGYYTVGEKKSYSKLEALEWGEPEWRFNDEVFSDIDWTIEPPFDLWELYKQRAKQIREQYDYVVLMYSGGSDSHNLLNAFLDADCKIDEIATFWDYEKTGDKDSYINAEVTRVVLPHIRKLQNEGHKFKFTLIDQSKVNQEPFNHKLDYEYYFNCLTTVNGLSKNFFRHHMKQWKDMIDNTSKKLVLVWGKEKPCIFYDNNLKKYYFQFYDQIDDAVGCYVQKNYSKGWYDELFYWTPDNPLIVIKQAHIIKRFLRTCHIKQFYQPPYSFFGYNEVLDMYLQKRFFEKLIYPKWDTNTFSNGKHGLNSEKRKTIHSPRDIEFLNGNSDNKQKYLSLISYVAKKNIEKNNFKFFQIPLRFSKQYWLE